MSILDIHKPDKIMPTKLFARGYVRDGWGSPMTRKKLNTKMYELVDGDWSIMWFPKTFEGYVCPGTTYSVDVRGRCLMTTQYANDHYISPILKTMDELDVFIHQVKQNKWPEIHKHLRDGIVKYYDPRLNTNNI